MNTLTDKLYLELLQRSSEYPHMRVQRSVGRLTFVAVMKLFFALACLGGSVALEYFYKQVQ